MARDEVADALPALRKAWLGSFPTYQAPRRDAREVHDTIQFCWQTLRTMAKELTAPDGHGSDSTAGHEQRRRQVG